MKSIISFLAIILVTGSLSTAQNQEKNIIERPLNSISINLLGDASIISINYERIFAINSTFIISSKLGFGYNEEFQLCIFGPCSSPPEKFLTIPHHITGNLGNGKHFFEFGFGGTKINGHTTQSYFLYPIIGYRLLPLNSGKINFRIFGQMPFSGFITDDILFSPVGLSLGVSF